MSARHARRAGWWRAGLLVLLAVAGFVLTRRGAPPTGRTLASVPSPAAVAAPPPGSAAPVDAGAVARRPRLVVAFRLDPSLTEGLYLGQRWVSPPEFHFAQAGAQFVVDAKAQQVGVGGARRDVDGDWATSDPEMVAITRHADGVTLVVRAAGTSDLVVRAGRDAKTLRVSAERLPDAMRVRISQP